MSVLTLSNGQRFLWEPTTELVCSYCRETLDVYRHPWGSIHTTNLFYYMFDPLSPAHNEPKSGLSTGKYWYLHRRCSRLNWLIVERKKREFFWGQLQMSEVLGLEKNHGMQETLKRSMPPGCYEQLYAQWIPAIKSLLSRTLPKLLMMLPSPLNDGPGEVYIIEAVGSGRVKIGRGRNTETRLAQLSTGTPFPLELRRIIKTDTSNALEHMLHTRYAQYRKHGEWFALPLSALNALLQEYFPSHT